MNRCSIIVMIVGLLLTTSSVVEGGNDAIGIDAPGILDTPGATYVLTKDVTAERTAFMIKGDGITLDLGGDRLVHDFRRPIIASDGMATFPLTSRKGRKPHYPQNPEGT